MAPSKFLLNKNDKNFCLIETGIFFSANYNTLNMYSNKYETRWPVVLLVSFGNLNHERISFSKFDQWIKDNFKHENSLILFNYNENK